GANHQPLPALLLLLDLLERLADHQRPAADRLLVVFRSEVALSVGFERVRFGGIGRSRRALGHFFRLDLQGGATGTKRDRDAVADRRGIGARPVHEQAVAALKIADDPRAVDERHFRVSPADVRVSQLDLAAPFPSDEKRGPEAESLSVWQADDEGHTVMLPDG